MHFKQLFLDFLLVIEMFNKVTWMLAIQENFNSLTI